MSMATATIVVWVLSAVASGQVPAPRKMKDVEPAYPRESLQDGDEGRVILELSVTTSGMVGQARLLGSHCTRLEQATLTAVRQWQYEPVRVNGNAVPSR